MQSMQPQKSPQQGFVPPTANVPGPSKDSVVVPVTGGAEVEREPQGLHVPRPQKPSGFKGVTQRVLGSVIRGTANTLWHLLQFVNRRIQARSFQPKWAPAPLMKSTERTFPQLGFPRQTDSLCPRCVQEVRGQILGGEEDVQVLIDGKPGEVRAEIIERDGEVWMVKECEKHGRFEDQMAMDVDFLRRIEKLYPGRDFKIAPDNLHDHGTSSMKYGRGAVLTVDLTNRCNMMCNPCFMDANQVGYVHELTWDDIKQILDNSISIKPRRQLSVQFSGGEPTLSPYFLDAVKYCRDLGYTAVQAATNGIRFAQDPEFARKAKAAGLRIAYLQFDGVDNEANSHRGVGNLFDVKLRALDNLKAAGIDATLVVTIVNTVNNHQVGPIIKFAVDNIEKINAISFQPVSFTGRDEDIDDETRKQQRYTLSHLAHDVKKQLGITEPMRDWYPLSASGPFSDLKDLMDGADSEWGSIKCGCHPNCGIGTMLLVNEETRETLSFPEILDVEQFIEDVKVITDSGRKKFWTATQFTLAVMRNYDFAGAPEGLGPFDVLRILDGHNGGSLGFADRGRYNWRMLLVAGMWFQDLFNYDFRRTEMCIIPYGTQVGEVSFCAYNTGIGWRQVVEHFHQNSSTADWFQTKGRHSVYAAGKAVPLAQLKGLGSTDSAPAPAEGACASAGCGR